MISDDMRCYDMIMVELYHFEMISLNHNTRKHFRAFLLHFSIPMNDNVKFVQQHCPFF